MKNKNLNTQGDVWDHYVTKSFPGKKEQSDDYNFPGDEWAKPKLWNSIFEEIMVPELGREAQYFIEIGSGSGKQSVRTLKHFNVKELHSFDISSEFIKVYKERFKSELGSKMFAHKLSHDYMHIYNICERRNLTGKVDCLYSFDAMVHVDLQHLFGYFLNAALVLKSGGKIIMDVANYKSDKGFDKLVRDVKSYYKFFGAACTKFQFLSEDVVQYLLPKIGFDVKICEDPRGHCLFVAELIDRDLALDAAKEHGLF